MRSKPLAEWMRGVEACASLCVSDTTLRKLADDGRIGVMRIEGLARTLYSRSDVERIKAQSLRPAKQARELATV